MYESNLPFVFYWCFHIDKSNKSGIVFFVFKGVTSRRFPIKMYVCYMYVPGDCVYINEQCWPWWNPHNAAFNKGLHCLSSYPFRDSRWFIALHNIDSCLHVYTYRPGLASINGERWYLKNYWVHLGYHYRNITNIFWPVIDIYFLQNQVCNYLWQTLAF